MIATNELETIASHVLQYGLSEKVISGLRNQFPSKHFTWCSEDDINAGKPVHETAAFNIYAVNSSDHCSVLTNDLDSASGLVFAEIYQD